MESYMSKCPIHVSESAAKRVKALLVKRNNPDLMLRITVLGGGCSGFQYRIGLEDKIQADDHVYDEQGIKVVIDETSAPLLVGTNVDYVEELIGASFQIKNPNAASSCGCGNSFSV
jgi:iron-sulfur cluster insertion protein